MACKFVVLALLVAAAHGSGHRGADYISFSYDVSDPHTGDVKSQHETRVGDNVVCQYWLLESDGSRRTVDYAADAHSGFHAIVRKDPAVVAPAAPAVVAAPVAPVVAARVAPAVVSAPVTPVASPPVTPVAYPHAAPLAYGPHAVPLSYAAAPFALGAAAYGAHGAIGYGAHGLEYAHLGW